MNKKKTAISEGLSAYIRHRYEIAKDFKSSEGVTATLHRCVRLVRGDPIVELDEALPRGVVANIASPIARGVIGDYREPAVLRFGITPLYLGFEDIWNAVQHLKETMLNSEWKNKQYLVRGEVT